MVIESHFPRPVRKDELQPGELFSVSWPNGFWLCVRADISGTEGALVIHSHTPGEPTPFVAWVRNLPEFVEKVTGEVTARPRARGVPVAHPYGTPGSLSVAPDGEIYLQSGGRGSRDIVALRSGAYCASLPEGSIHYAEWELVLSHPEGSGHRASVIASYPSKAD